MSNFRFRPNKKEYIFEKDLKGNTVKKTILFTLEDYAMDNHDAMTNPFLYRNKEHILMSIEDFATFYKPGLFKKKKVVYLRSVIRNENISKFRRWHEFKKFVNNSKNDYLETLSNIKLKKIQTETNFSLVKKVRVNNFLKIIAFIVIIFNLIFTLFYDFFKWNLFSKTFLKGVYNKLSIYSSKMLPIFIISVCLTIIYLLYKFLFLNSFMFKVHRQKNIFARFNTNYKKSIKEFKKGYRKLYMYYKRAIHSHTLYFPCYDMNAIWSLKINYYSLLEINDDIEKVGIKIIKIRRTNKLIVSLMYLLMVGLNVFLLVKTIILLFN